MTKECAGAIALLSQLHANNKKRVLEKIANDI